MVANKRTKSIALIMILIFSVSVVITVVAGNVRQPQNRLSIVASFYPLYSALNRVTQGVDGVEVVNLTPSQTGCLHDYQLVPDDVIALTNADALVINGLGMEGFLDDSINFNPDMKVLDTSISASLLPLGHSHHKLLDEHVDQHEHEHEHHFNEHIWTSPTNHIVQVKNINNFMIEIDPANAEKYQKNSGKYIKEIEDIKKRLIDTAKLLPTKNCIIFHDSLCYLAKEIGLDSIAELSLGEQSNVSANQLAEAALAARKSNKVILLYDRQYDADYNNVAAGASYVKVLKLDTAVVDTGKDTDAWIEAMKYNLMQLKEAVN